MVRGCGVLEGNIRCDERQDGGEAPRVGSARRKAPRFVGCHAIGGGSDEVDWKGGVGYASR